MNILARVLPTLMGPRRVPSKCRENGLPINLLANEQTTEGFPKIATVIWAELPRLASCERGDILRFTGVSVAEAEAVARTQAGQLAEVTTFRVIFPIRRMTRKCGEGTISVLTGCTKMVVPTQGIWRSVAMLANPSGR